MFLIPPMPRTTKPKEDRCYTSISLGNTPKSGGSSIPVCLMNNNRKSTSQCSQRTDLPELYESRIKKIVQLQDDLNNGT